MDCGCRTAHVSSYGPRRALLPTIKDARRIEAALAIWQSGMVTLDTPAESYLASRGLCLPLPATLRFHPGLKHPSGMIWQAMVQLVTHGSDDIPLAIHRTFLTPNGLGKGPVVPKKMMLGPCRGGV